MTVVDHLPLHESIKILIKLPRVCSVVAFQDCSFDAGTEPVILNLSSKARDDCALLYFCLFYTTWTTTPGSYSRAADQDCTC